jgi:predicted metal-binding membrane protein
MSAEVSAVGTARRAKARGWVVWGGLFAVAALAWAITISQARTMGNGIGTMGLAFGPFLVFWTVMMAAMMLPSVAPFASLYLRTIRATGSSWVEAPRGSALVAGYLLVWAAFGVFVFVMALAGGRLADAHPSQAPWVAAGLLVAAGIYQLTPLKDRCLRHCRSPLGFLMLLANFRGRTKDLRVGLYHGAYCVGCCWGMMLVLIVVGVMNIAWMAGLAAVILVEKTWRHGKAVGIVFGVALIVLALFVPWHPSLVPGLHAVRDMGSMGM